MTLSIHSWAFRRSFRLTAAGLAPFFSVACLRSEAADPAPELSALKKLSVEQLTDIEVTSVSRAPEKLSDSASAIQVVTQDEIRRSGAAGIPEALRLAGNLEVAQKNARDWGISARGFNTELANKLLVLIDGRSVYTPLFSGVFWDAQDYLLEDIDRIEVISGPGGTLWGANAVNGVINITTKSAKETQGSYLEAGGGTALSDFGGGRYGGTLAPDVYFRVYAKTFERSSGVKASGQDASNSWRMSQAGFRADSEKSAENPLTLQGDYYAGTAHVVSGGTAQTSGGNLLGRWSHIFSSDSVTALQAYYDRTHLVDPVAASAFAPAGYITDDLGTFDVDFQHRFAPGARNRVVWGLGYRYTHDALANAKGLAFLPARLDQSLFSGFAQDEIILQPDLRFTLGSKVEHNGYTGFEFEPSGRLQWELAPHRMVWTAVSRAVRTPSRVDRDIHQPSPPPAVLAGGADFASETVVAYELGYRAEIGSSMSASVSAFHNEYGDVRSLGTTPVTILPLVFQNNLQGHTDGAEASVVWQVAEGWRLRGSYDRLRERLGVKAGQVDLNHALNETSDPQSQCSLRSSLDLARNLECDAGLRWVGPLRNNNGGVPGSVPSYFELDVRIGWRPTDRLELSVVGQNLLHNHHPEFGLPSLNREEVSRGVYGKVAWRY